MTNLPTSFAVAVASVALLVGCADTTDLEDARDDLLVQLLLVEAERDELADEVARLQDELAAARVTGTAPADESAEPTATPTMPTPYTSDDDELVHIVAQGWDAANATLRNSICQSVRQLGPTEYVQQAYDGRGGGELANFFGRQCR